MVFKSGFDWEKKIVFSVMMQVNTADLREKE
jgi:hypothetical protein